LDNGAVLAFGSDAPVETISPWEGLYAALTRQTREGQPEGGWYPDQCLTVAEALRAYTIGAAHAAGESHIKGTIAEGKVADLIILDRDILEIPPQDILGTQVEMTILGGEVVYEK
jgi:predicted amidohydrolase YtcJ